MAIRIQIPKEVKVVSQSETEAEVLLEGLYPGYGVTVGNALRRVLLSSLPGAAIVSFRVEGVPHEFSTIPGVMEDVVEIALNLKRIRLHVFGDEPVTLTLKSKGERTVKAKDIAKHASVEIMNPETHIATITGEKTSLEMAFKAERGIGYLPVEFRKREKLPIGEIAIDANFSPVTRVNFHVENMRVGDRTDYNRLRLIVKTDGTLDPLSSIREACEILNEHFAIFETLPVPEVAAARPVKKVAKTAKKRTVKKK